MDAAELIGIILIGAGVVVGLIERRIMLGLILAIVGILMIFGNIHGGASL